MQSSQPSDTRRSDKPVHIPRLKEDIFGFTDEDNISTVIDVDCQICGYGELPALITLTGNKGLMVSGRLLGHIASDGAIFVGKDGVIEGSVKCRKLIVDGRVDAGDDGLIEVDQMLGLSGRSEVRAKQVAYGDIEMARGCRISGDLAPRNIDRQEDDSFELSHALDEPSEKVEVKK